MPHGTYELQGPEHQLDYLNLTVVLSAHCIHGRDPALPGVIDTGIGHQEVLRLLDAHHIIIDQHLDGLPPEVLIHINPEVVEPNVALLAHLARQLAEPEDPPEAGRFNGGPPGIAQDHLWGQVVHAPLGVQTFVRPMAPELIVLHELRVLPIHRLPIGRSRYIGVQHAALDGEAPFGEVVPGMPAGNGGPADAELLQTGTQRQKHSGIITDDCLGRPPLGNGLAADLDDAGEVLPIETARAHKGPTVAVEQENAVEPMPLDLDQIPHIDAPDLMERRGVLGTFVRIR